MIIGNGLNKKIKNPQGLHVYEADAQELAESSSH